MTLTDAIGRIRMTTPTAFGYHYFEDVGAGATYILTASRKHFTFSQTMIVLNVTEDTDQNNFIANSDKRLRQF